MANIKEEALATATAVKKEPLLYDAQCAKCQKWTKVVFKPDNKRPVYCKTCLKNVQRAPAAPVAPVAPANKEKIKKEPEIEKINKMIKEALKPKDTDNENG